ncbi:MAG: hypothetical protein KatS3mg043_0863 [Rhodothermaceae bacterium]|nr:MAG: hypothetical protein KatS3mg043_0863 [Rhodothermaceae bacterium]
MQLLSLFTTAPAPVAPAEEGGTPAGHAPGTGLFGALLSRLRGLPAPEEPAPEASGTAFGAVHEHDVTLVAGTLPSESVPVTGKERLPEQAVSTHPEEAGATGAVAPPQETSRPAPVVEAGTGAPSPDAGEASDHTPPGPSSDDAAPPQALPPVREPLLPVHATGIRDTGPSPDGSTRPARTGPSVQGTAGTPAASDSDPAPLPPRTDGKPAPLPPQTDGNPPRCHPERTKRLPHCRPERTKRLPRCRPESDEHAGPAAAPDRRKTRPPAAAGRKNFLLVAAASGGQPGTDRQCPDPGRTGFHRRRAPCRLHHRDKAQRHPGLGDHFSRGNPVFGDAGGNNPRPAGPGRIGAGHRRGGERLRAPERSAGPGDRPGCSGDGPDPRLRTGSGYPSSFHPDAPAGVR